MYCLLYPPFVSLKCTFFINTSLIKSYISHKHKLSNRNLIKIPHLFLFKFPLTLEFVLNLLSPLDIIMLQLCASHIWSSSWATLWNHTLVWWNILWSPYLKWCGMICFKQILHLPSTKAKQHKFNQNPSSLFVQISTQIGICSQPFVSIRLDHSAFICLSYLVL